MKETMVELATEKAPCPNGQHESGQLVCVTVCTLNRPVMLEKCLRSIAGQTMPSGWRFCLVVVENSEDAKSKSIAEQVKTETGIDLVYEIEPDRGIPQARNRALSVALKVKADWIVFIDDDETAEPGWLDAYCKAAQRYDAQILRGPVRLAYPPETPEWFPRVNKDVGETGTGDVMFSTSNLMISQHIVSPQGYGLTFNEEMRFTGGSDWEFCAKAVKLGARPIAVSDAWVVEEVTRNRVTLKWLLRRQTRVSANKTWSRIRKLGRIQSFVVMLFQAGFRVFYGIVIFLVAALTLPIAPTRSRYLAARGLISFAAAIGYVLPAFGVVPEPYRNIDGH